MDYKKAHIFNGYENHDDNKFRIQNGILNDRSDILKGFPVRQMIIWDKGGSVNFNDTYFLPSYEVIYLLAGPDFKLAPKANLNRDVWYIYPQKGSGHPAPFPEALSDKIISSTTADIILDPFMGSGTTAISALKCDRQYIGIDNSQKYCEMAEQRIKDYLSQGKLFKEN